MFRLSLGRPYQNCSGTSRRHALRLGACGLIGGLTLPRLLELQALAASPISAKAKSCIFLFLEGGPPHQDMWDPKPEAPPEIRGPFGTISTNVPDIFVTDQLPLCAQMADKYTILRSHSHNDNGHSTGYHYVMTGHRPSFADGDNPVPNNEYFPSIGSAVSRTLGQPDFEVKDLRPPGHLSDQRLSLRKQLLSGIDHLERERNQSQGKAMSTYYEKAYSLVTSEDARKAFNIHAEPDAVRDAYGRTQLGQCALLARRLVEGGCRFVGVDAPGWDVHFNCFPSLKTDLIPYADRAFSALVTDLEQRGLLDETLVVMMGEMGRTPRINAQAGRDHWSMAQTIIFAGGGTKPGQVIGATDKHATAPTENPVSVNDLLRTISVLMGIDPDRTFLGPLGRPVPIVDGGKVIHDLI